MNKAERALMVSTAKAVRVLLIERRTEYETPKARNVFSNRIDDLDTNISAVERQQMMRGET